MSSSTPTFLARNFTPQAWISGSALQFVEIGAGLDLGYGGYYGVVELAAFTVIAREGKSYDQKGELKNSAKKFGWFS